MRKAIRLLDTYLFCSVLVPFLYCSIAFLFFYVVYDLTISFDEYIKAGATLLQLLHYYFFLAPSVFVHVTPIATLISVLYAIGMLSRHNEFMAMRSNGISYTRAVLPFFMFGCTIVVAVFILNECIVPSYSRKVAVILRDEIKKTVHKDTEIAFYNRHAMRDWIAHFTQDEYVFRDVEIRQFDSDGRIIQKVFAKVGQWLDRGWWFFDGKIFNFDENNNLQGNIMKFKKIHMPYREQPNDFIQSQEDIAYMNFVQLMRHIKIHPPGSKAAIEKTVDLQFKIAFPFISLVSVMFGVPIALMMSRGGPLYGIGISFIVCLLFYLFITVSLIFGKEGYLSPLIAAWLANMVFASSGAFVFYRLR